MKLKTTNGLKKLFRRIASAVASGQYEETLITSLLEQLNNILEKLTYRERVMICLLNGLPCNEEGAEAGVKWTRAQVAQLFNVTDLRVKQITAKGYGRLKLPAVRLRLSELLHSHASILIVPSDYQMISRENPTNLSDWTRYDNCTFYLDPEKQYSCEFSTFDNCSFRVTTTLENIVFCRFTNCNFSRLIITGKNWLSDEMLGFKYIDELSYKQLFASSCRFDFSAVDNNTAEKERLEGLIAAMHENLIPYSSPLEMLLPNNMFTSEWLSEMQSRFKTRAVMRSGDTFAM